MTTEEQSDDDDEENAFFTGGRRVFGSIATMPPKDSIPQDEREETDILSPEDAQYQALQNKVANIDGERKKGKKRGRIIPQRDEVQEEYRDASLENERPKKKLKKQSKKNKKTKEDLQKEDAEISAFLGSI